MSDLMGDMDPLPENNGCQVAVRPVISGTGILRPRKAPALGRDTAESSMVLRTSAPDLEDAWLTLGSCDHEIRNRQKYRSLSQE